MNDIKAWLADPESVHDPEELAGALEEWWLDPPGADLIRDVIFCLQHSAGEIERLETENSELANEDRVEKQRAEAAKAEVARLREALQETAEQLELLANKLLMPTESAAPKSDADSFGTIGVLKRARQALAGTKDQSNG